MMSAARRKKLEVFEINDDDGDVNDDGMNEELAQSLICLITYGPLEDPVIAEDGYTYSRDAIEQWFSTCESSETPCTSPITGEQLISKRLVPNHSIRSVILKHKRTLLRKSRKQTKAAPAEANIKVNTIEQLGNIFQVTDPLRALLTKINFAPPRIVVLGMESTGKSTIMERLCMAPLFPRGENICTRAILTVKLRRGPAKPPTLQLCDLDGSPKRNSEPQMLSTENAAEHILNEQNLLVQEENQGLKGLYTRGMLVIETCAPHLPNLDLVDLPGIVAAAGSGEPNEMPSMTANLVRNYLDTHSTHALFLVTVPCCEKANASLAIRIIQDRHLESRTIGVFTMSDQARPYRVRQQVSQTASGTVLLQPHGYVATALSTTPGVDLSCNHGNNPSNYKRIQTIAENEASWFMAQELEDLLQGERPTASANGLLVRLDAMFLEYVRTSWLPCTIRTLQTHSEEFTLRDNQLGQPRAHKEELITPDLKKSLWGCFRTHVVEALNSDGFQKVLADMRQSLQSNVVERLKSRNVKLDKIHEAITRRRTDIKNMIIESAMTLPLIAVCLIEDATSRPSSLRLQRFASLSSMLTDACAEEIKARIDSFILQVPGKIEELINECTSPWVNMQMNESGIVRLSFLTESICSRIHIWMATTLITSCQEAVITILDLKLSSDLSTSMFIENCAREREEVIEQNSNILIALEKLSGLMRQLPSEVPSGA